MCIKGGTKMNNSRILYDQVLTLAGQLKTSAQNMESVLNEVKTLLNRVGSDAWSGNSANIAKERFDALVAKFPEFYNVTGQCYEHLTSVVEGYKNMDNMISKM